MANNENNLCPYGNLIRDGMKLYLNCTIENQSCWCTYYCNESKCGLRHNRDYHECKNYKEKLNETGSNTEPT